MPPDCGATIPGPELCFVRQIESELKMKRNQNTQIYGWRSRTAAGTAAGAVIVRAIMSKSIAWPVKGKGSRQGKQEKPGRQGRQSMMARAGSERRAIKSRLQFVLLISMLLALFARRKLSLTSNRNWNRGSNGVRSLLAKPNLSLKVAPPPTRASCILHLANFGHLIDTTSKWPQKGQVTTTPYWNIPQIRCVNCTSPSPTTN